MEERFNYLLQKYLEGAATPEEEEALKRLVLSNRYEEHFRQGLFHYMEKKIRHPEDIPAPIDADRLYEEIVNRRHPRSPRIFPWHWARIAAAVVLMLGAGWWFFYKPLPPSGQPQQIISESEVVSDDSVIRFSRKDFIRLPDGSTVLLNDDSELSYRLPFGGGKREVTLKGEAFFDIIHDKEKPFVVRTGNISTNVLGTAFNINAGNSNVVVTVERGLVQVTDETRTLSLVRPDERLTVNTLTSNFEKTGVKAAEEIRWKSQGIIFDDIPLRQAVDILQAHFGAHIGIENPGIENCRISAWFLENESLDEILEMVCGTRQARYSKRDNMITIAGGIACEP